MLSSSHYLSSGWFHCCDFFHCHQHLCNHRHKIKVLDLQSFVRFHLLRVSRDFVSSIFTFHSKSMYFNTQCNIDYEACHGEMEKLIVTNITNKTV